MRRLSDLIVPADETSKGALDGGAPEYIDLLSSNNPDFAIIYTGGLPDWTTLRVNASRRQRSLQPNPTSRPRFST